MCSAEGESFIAALRGKGVSEPALERYAIVIRIVLEAVAKLEGESLEDYEADGTLWVPRGKHVWQTGNPYAVRRGFALPDDAEEYADKERATVKTAQTH